jgi:hypothetical protein
MSGMSRIQAELFWVNLNLDQKRQFMEMFRRLSNGELMLKHVNVDDNETIQSIVLEPKDKPSAPIEPFAKYFNIK